MIRLEIIDLPKGYPIFLYKPVRPEVIQVRRKGAEEVETVRCDIQNPLKLQVGDVVIADKMPKQLTELTRDNSGHPPYAVITTQGSAPQEDKPKVATKQSRRKSTAKPIQFVK